MAKLFTTIPFCVLVLCVAGVFGAYNESTTEFVFTIVGLYSECLTNTSAENRTELNRVASLTREYANILSYINANFTKIQYGSQMKIDIHNYDICSEEGTNDDVMKIIENMILDNDYFFQEPGKKYKTSTIGAFFIFMNDEQTKHFKSLVHGIPIFEKEEIIKYSRAFTIK